MGKILRNMGLFLIVIIITAIVFFIVVKNKQVKRDVLEYSLDLLGTKLFSMVPEGADKKALEEKYNAFMQKAVKREVSPEQIEVVAANILNVSNIDTTLTPQQAEAVLSISLETPLQIEIEGGEWIESRAEKAPTASVAVPAIPKKRIKYEKWESLGKRISSMYEFNENMQTLIRENIARHRELHRQMQYRFDTGLKLALDTNLRNKLEQREYKRLARELRQLEKEKMLDWRENFAEEMKQQMEQMRKELSSLKELRKLHKLKELQKLEALEALESLESLEALRTIPISLKGLHGLESLKVLESLKSLEALKNIPVIDADSIRKVVEESLKEAGIEPQK